jgi:hypothetical protein
MKKAWTPGNPNIYDVDKDIEQMEYELKVCALYLGITDNDSPSIDELITEANSMFNGNYMESPYKNATTMLIEKHRFFITKRTRYANWILSIAKGIKNGS